MGFATQRWLATAVFFTALVVIACRPTVDGQGSATKAVSNEPQGYDHFIAVLKLSTPALLSSAHKLGSKVILDEEQKAVLLCEQDEAVASLQRLSSDIQILYRYRLVLNGLAVIAPRSLEAEFRKMAAVSYFETDEQFTSLPPVATATPDPTGSEDLVHDNSVTFIGAGRVHDELKITGKGIRVGVIDTGIDYTHAMFGGTGTASAFTAVDPAKVAPGSFPTAKVVGGIDLVGSTYDSASPDFSHHIPQEDANPIDEQGHGTHVAGTIAGRGDGLVTYSGVAPDASLYAIKIFGKTGSTSDAVIIKALEVAANPAGDLDPSDHLDVINLSVGGGFGTPHILFSEAVSNLSKGETAMVAAAGNDGATPYIVSAPSTAPDAFSVAATIDGMDHNWKFNAVSFSSAAHPVLLSEAVEASFSLPIAKAGDVTHKLVYLGTAASDFTPAQKAALQGNIALLDRGVVAFFDKVQRAFAAGAAGVVVANNVDGSPAAMGGGTSTLAIPAIMISKALADTIKGDLAQGDVVMHFQTKEKVAKPELIDSITDFSSRGPRSLDGLLKPEIAAPGANVISAKMGSGNEAVQLSGTSMATPHMAGVMALLKAAHPEASVATLKSLVMGTALEITDVKSGKIYALSTMGAGRVQAYAAATATLATTPAALSLGVVQVATSKTVATTLELTNLAGQAATLTLTAATVPGVTIDLPSQVQVRAHGAKRISVKITLQPADPTDAAQELSTFIHIANAANQTVTHVPVFAVVDRISTVRVDSFVAASHSPQITALPTANLTLTNSGILPGEALLFNLLGRNARQYSTLLNPLHSGPCALESAGWRLVHSSVSGADVTLLQIAVKLYSPLTSWQLCDVSAQFDGTGSGVADQELVGTNLASLNGNNAVIGTFVSALTDAAKMRSIRRDFELAPATAKAADYTPAVLDNQDYTVYDHSTIAVVSADVSKLTKTASGAYSVKLALLANSQAAATDDYLAADGNINGSWLTIDPAAQSFSGLPTNGDLTPGETKTFSFQTNGSAGDLVVYLPYNLADFRDYGRDQQQIVLAPTVH